MAKIKKIKLSGVTYDIEDASAIHSETKLSVEASGSGNAVTGVEVSDHKITVTKGETFAKKSELDAESSERARVDAALSDRVGALEQRGRYLSGWNCSTGIPTTYPTIAVGETYTYKSGDYYIVTVGGTAGDKMPKGTGITRTDSGYTVPTDSIPTGETVAAGDTYTYDGTNFILSHSANNNQTVTSGAVSFGPNDAVDFVGSGIVSVSGDASTKKITISASHQDISGKQDKLAVTGSANKPVYVSAAGVVSACSFTVDKSVPSDAVFTDHITSVASTGSGNVVTAMTASDGNITYTKGISVSDGAQVNVIENVAIGSIQGSISDKVANFESQVAGKLALQDSVSASDITATIASAGAHSHSLSGTISGSGSITVPTVSKTTNKLVTTSISKDVASKATAGTAMSFNTDAIKSATCNQSFVTSAIKSATGTFNTDAIKDITLSTTTTSTDGPAVVTAVGATTLTGSTTFVTSAINSASLTGTTTFVTGFASGSEAYHANYNSADECLELSIASVATAAVGISTSAAATGTVGISSGAVTTKYMKHENTNASTGSVATEAAGTAAVSIETSAATTDSITPYTFADVNVATIASALTVATGGLSSTGSGGDVTSTISIGTSEQAITVSASLSGTTGSAGEHNHDLA